MRLTLLVPELLWPEPDDRQTLDGLALPGLEWLLARGRGARSARSSHEATLAGLFGLQAPAYAALRRCGEADGADAEAGNGFWLCADPVHLRMHNQHIILADARAFDIDAAEAEALVAALNVEFGDIGTFQAATPQRWYLRLKAPVDHVAEPISVVASRRLHGDLSGKTSPLYRWLNEVQMFLFVHPVNARRTARGQPAINSLWLWGAGALPAAGAADRMAVWSDDALARGLARHAGLPARPRPADLAKLLAQPESDRHLVLLDQLQDAALHEQGAAWRQALGELEADWFLPARKALGGRLSSLHLVAPTIYGQLRWTLRPADGWKLWRRSPALPGLIRDIAQGAPA